MDNTTTDDSPASYMNSGPAPVRVIRMFAHNMISPLVMIGMYVNEDENITENIIDEFAAKTSKIKDMVEQFKASFEDVYTKSQDEQVIFIKLMEIVEIFKREMHAQIKILNMLISNSELSEQTQNMLKEMCGIMTEMVEKYSVTVMDKLDYSCW